MSKVTMGIEAGEALHFASPRLQEGHFLLPGRADEFARPLTDTDAKTLQQRRDFAHLQADAANAVITHLETLGPRINEDDWAKTYFSLIEWRADLGIGPLDANCRNTSLGNERLRLPLTDEDPNCDRIGTLGQLRTNTVWDEEHEVWVGGTPTPASLTFERAAKYATDHFEAVGATGDELQTLVMLPDGSWACGNRILRGNMFKRISLEFKASLAERGYDVSHFEINAPGAMLVISAPEADRKIMFEAAMSLLANQTRGQCVLSTLTDIAYLLFQSPLTKRGSDAVIRTFLTAAGTYLTNKSVVLPHDIDLRALTAGQAVFKHEVAEEIEILSEVAATSLPRY